MSENVHVFPQANGRPGTQGVATMVSPAALRSVMGRFATGVVVISVGGEHIHGMTANAFGSVSLDPPMVHCCIAHSARMHGALTSAGHFAVSVMSASQETMAGYFADKARPLGSGQFDTVDWEPGPVTGAPLLSGALGWLECEVAGEQVAGDHSLFLGRVLMSGQGADDAPLVFYQGKFQRVMPR